MDVIWSVSGLTAISSGLVVGVLGDVLSELRPRWRKYECLGILVSRRKAYQCSNGSIIQSFGRAEQWPSGTHTAFFSFFNIILNYYTRTCKQECNTAIWLFSHLDLFKGKIFWLWKLGGDGMVVCGYFTAAKVIRVYENAWSSFSFTRLKKSLCYHFLCHMECYPGLALIFPLSNCLLMVYILQAIIKAAYQKIVKSIKQNKLKLFGNMNCETMIL